MLLQELLYKVQIQQVIGSTNLEVNSIEFDSRKVKHGNCFVAVKGSSANGHQFIDAVCKSGAIAIVCEKLPEVLNDQVTYVVTLNSHQALAMMCCNFYNNPSQRLKLVGVTGTNGKTTVATMLHQLFMQLGYQVGLISTVENKINEEIIPSTHTTPDAMQLNKLLAQMVENKCSHVFMEVSSHAIHQERIHGLKFEGAIFTNISLDHLDYHKTMDEYIRVKKQFFDNLHFESFALSNIDDKRGRVMLQNTKAKQKTYSLTSLADFKAKLIDNSFDGLLLNVDGYEVHFRMVGKFNAYNLLAVYAAASLLGESKLEVLRILSNLSGASGRFETVKSKTTKVTAIVDYAHTPDALQNVLSTINEVRNGNEKLITVIGCGGDRDKSKRPLMAEIASRLSTNVILTSDNPRSENPDSILAEMNAGVPASKRKSTITIPDRMQAIKTACALAENSDIILVAGKGHEKYQETAGVKVEFDDKKILQNMLDEK